MSIDPEILAKIKKIEIQASKMVSHNLTGEYQSAFRGSGMEFEKVRQYTEGDDARLMDWNVTARMQQPYVRVYQEERERNIIVMLDVSESQSFSSSSQTKREVSAEFSAVLSLLATHTHDRVGLIIFSDQIEHFVPPQRGKAHVWKMIQTVLCHNNKSRKTDLSAAFHYFMKIQKRPSLCFVISDFCDNGFQQELKQMACRHDVIAVQVFDQLERQLPESGCLRMQDVETSQVLFHDLSDDVFRKKYKENFQANEYELKKFFANHKIDYMQISPQSGYFDEFLKLMKRRERKV